MAWWRRGGSDPAPSRVAAAASPRAPAPVQRAAWEDLPPIRPVLTATEPVAPLDSFTSSLATARNPSFLAPLAHQVDPAGPSGQVEGLASPVVPQTMSGGPELAVGPRPAPSRRSQVAAVVQRALAPRVRFSEPDAASTASAAVIPAAAPAPDHPSADESSLGSRQLEPVEIPAPRSLTAAPDPGELSTLPVVSSPSAPAMSSSTVSAVPTVSRARVVRGVERARPPRPPSRTRRCWRTGDQRVARRRSTFRTGRVRSSASRCPAQCGRRCAPSGAGPGCDARGLEPGGRASAR